MKQGTIVTRITMLLLFLAVLAYLGGAAWRSFQDPYPTVAAYTYILSDTSEATGLLVRDETVIPGQGGIVDVLPSEGEKVGAGQSVAVIYRDAAALDRKRDIRALELEMDQLDYSIRRGNAGWDNAKLDESIVDAMVSLRSSAATGDLTGLEDQALSLKSLILSRESTFAGTAGIEGLVQSVSAQMQSLQSAASMDTTPISVSGSGTFSALADGYESILTPAVLDTLTPQILNQFSAQKPEAPVGAVGKLITGSRWYFAANLPEAVTKRLIEGRTVTIRFSRDWSGDVSMRVERISAPQNGQCAVTFSASSHLSQITLLRKQTVDIIFSSIEGIRVPKNALRTETRFVTDEKTGEVLSQYEVTGVYVITGAQAEFRAVDILGDDGDHYVVKSPDTAGKKTLRTGDDVVVASAELFDGKVIR